MMTGPGVAQFEEGMSRGIEPFVTGRVRTGSIRLEAGINPDRWSCEGFEF